MRHEHGEAESAQELARTVEDIRRAEEKGGSLLEAARRKAEERKRSARERVVEIAVKADEDALGLKNRLLAAGRREIEKETERITGKAKAESKKLSQEAVSQHVAEAIAKKILGM